MKYVNENAVKIGKQMIEEGFFYEYLVIFDKMYGTVFEVSKKNIRRFNIRKGYSDVLSILKNEGVEVRDYGATYVIHFRDVIHFGDGISIEKVVVPIVEDRVTGERSLAFSPLATVRM